MMNIRNRSRRAATLPIIFVSILTRVAHAAPPPVLPSTGSILQQVAPLPRLPVAPGPVISIPASPQQKLESRIRIPVRRVEITGNSLVPTSVLAPILRPLDGRSVTLGTLQTYADRIAAVYHARGYPLAYAYLPPQKIHNGVIRLAIVEPRYDRILIAGHARLRPGQIRRTLNVRPGDPVAQAPLDRGILLLNQIPGVQVAGELLPGAQPGTSSLRLTPKEERLLGVNLTESNYGDRYTGANVTSATATADDPFGYGSALSVNGTTSDSGALNAGSFDLTSPYIWNGLTAELYGSATNYRLKGAFATLNQVGRASQIGGALNDPVLLEPGRAVVVRLDIFDTWLAQSTRSTGLNAQQRIPIERLSVSGSFADPWGGVTTGRIAVSHGNLTITPAGATALDAAGPKAAGSFEFGQFLIEQQQVLPRAFRLTLEASGQISGQNLDSSQQFYLGGPYGVMSYAVGTGGGDEGYLFSTRLSHSVPVPRLPGALTAAIFAQTGSIWTNHTLYPGFSGRNKVTESGVGVGLGYRWHIWNVDLDYARRLGANAFPSTRSSANQFWFTLSCSI